MKDSESAGEFQAFGPNRPLLRCCVLAVVTRRAACGEKNGLASDCVSSLVRDVGVCNVGRTGQDPRERKLDCAYEREPSTQSLRVLPLLIVAVA